ncbi:MAG: DUF2812 domain-containing protein [Lachnospiraceae bacterium]|nr:DUF2812 domain-containing protein [Lachnospiraceae bacterium]
MIKFRLYFDKDAETAWLNRMAADGWAVNRFFAGFFSFESCEKGAFVYQVDFSDRLFSVSSDYRELMQDAGIEIVQTWGYWVILRKKASEGKFELYTDCASSIEHYKKIRRMFKAVTIVEMLLVFFEIYMGASQGVKLGYIFAILLTAILAGLMNAVIRLNVIIAGLEEKMTGISKKCMSVLWAVGCMLNVCGLLLMDVMPHMFRHAIQILAIALMIIGMFQTFRRK